MSKVVFGLVLLLLAEPEVVLDARRAVHAVRPGRRRAPGELRRLGRGLEHLAGAEQRLHVDPVVRCPAVVRDRHGVPLRCEPAHSPAGWSTIPPSTPDYAPAHGVWNGRRPGRPRSVGTVETQHLDLPDPLPLDCGRTLTGVRVAYETYGTLAPARDNVILVCHALSGDAHAAGEAPAGAVEGTRDGFAAEERDGARGKALGWWDGMIGPGKAFDTDHFFVVSTNLLGGCKGTTGPVVDRPRDRAAVRVRLPGGHRRRPGAHAARVPRRARHRAARGRGRRLARRDAGAGVGGHPPRPGRRRHRHRQHARARAAGHGLERDRPRVDPARPGLAGRALPRHRPRARRRHGRRPDGRPRDLPVRPGARRQVRPPAAARRRRSATRSPSRSSRSRATCATRPTRSCAVRRQHLPLHVARADLLRPRPGPRATATSAARSRRSPDVRC